MDAIDLLNSDLADLPRVETEGLYGIRLQTAFDSYAAAVENLTAKDFASQAILASLPRIRELSKHLLAAHSSILNGRLAGAHARMSDALTCVAGELKVLGSKPLNRQALGTLFRLREAASAERVDRGGMFHIPFHLRYKVASKRYSLLGLPMLYLGSTVMICWEELGRLPFDALWVSAMRLKENATVRVLDFGYRPALIAAILDREKCADTHDGRFAVAYAVLWPLIAACSFPRQQQSSPFIEEYVLPQQLVAHLVESHEFDGIRYFSNRVYPHGGDLINLNFVFPAAPGVTRGYCNKLSSLFELTPPMPLPMVKLLGSPLNQGTPLLKSREGTVEPYPGHRVAYQYTEFAQIESYIFQQTFLPIDNPPDA